jgi:outer membrane protein assembly factor BamB
LIRIDSEGEVLWERTYGPDKFGQSLTFGADGNLLVSGVTISDNTGIDVYLLKIDLEGNELWSKILRGPLDEWPHTIVETSDGGFILFGNCVDPNDFITDPGAAGYGGFEGRSNILLIKTNEMGEEVWRRVYESEDNIMSVGGVQTPDGGYAVVATIMYFPNQGDDQLVIKADENGEEVWSLTWEDGRTNARDMLLTSNGELLILSLFSASGDPREGDADILMTKLDQDGNEIWSKIFGEQEMVELGSALAETSDGGYIIVADRTKDLRRSPSEMILAKVSKEGQVIWEKCTARNPHFMIAGVTEHKAGGYLLVTNIQQADGFDILVVKTNAQGEVDE